MEKKALKPYVIASFEAILMFLFTPVFVILLGCIKVIIFSKVVYILVALGLVVYFDFVVNYYFVGIWALRDWISGSFVSEKFEYEVTNVDNYFFLTDIKTKKKKKLRKWEIPERMYTVVFCSREGGEKVVFLSTIYHAMERGEIYRIVYGMHSKIIVSVLSEKNQELLDVPMEKSSFVHD